MRPHPRRAAPRPRALGGAHARRRGTEILTETRLERAEAGAATLSDGRRLETATIVWAAGVAPNPVAAALGLPLDARGRVRVEETLRVSGMRDVWALGDGAAVPNAATPGETDPPTCQHALRQARRLARSGADVMASPRQHTVCSSAHRTRTHLGPRSPGRPPIRKLERMIPAACHAVLLVA